VLCPFITKTAPVKPQQTSRLIELFQSIQCHSLRLEGLQVQEFPPELSELQKTKLELVAVAPEVYEKMGMREKIQVQL